MMQVVADPAAHSAAAAEQFVVRAERAVAAEGRFSVALSGGSTPNAMYKLLASPTYRVRVNWSATHVFWGDERCVPLDDPRSNCLAAREALLDHVPIPAGQVHPMTFDGDSGRSAAAYQRTLKAYFGGGPPRFDLVLLGLGEDGHTASLFPATAVLDEQNDWVGTSRRRGDDFDRITLTAPVINQAAAVMFLVSGSSKAEVLREVLEGPRDASRLPAQLIRPLDGALVWLVDKAAAAKLPG
jgi:6-phosphogluconolactonase